MVRPNQENSTNFERLLSIWLIVIGLIIVTAIIAGVQVYWWQRSIAKIEQQKLIQKINRLQNEIKILKENSQPLPGQIKPKTPKEQYFQDRLAGKDQKAITALQRKDMKSLASLIHPIKGARLSPYLYINLETDLVFGANELRYFFRDHRNRIWGYYEGTSTPIRLTDEVYYKSYLYDADYAHAAKIRLNPELRDDLTTGNVFEVYPKGIVVEYQSLEGNNQREAAAWRSLKLVFEIEGKSYYLVGIIHDQWTI
jgi:hypothetical protein